MDIDLVGRIDSYKGGIRTTFDTVPDVPVSQFVLTLPGGKHGPAGRLDPTSARASSSPGSNLDRAERQDA